MGTNYLRVFVELMQGGACALPRGPIVTIIDADGKVIARDSDIVDPEVISIDYITGYYIGWAADCTFSATGDLSARVEISTGTFVDMPIGDFRPSCVDGLPDYNSVFMYFDDAK